MALNKLNYNSLNATPTASTALSFTSGADGLEASGTGGAWTKIKTLTASSSATLSFVDGTSDVVLDGTYAEYIFLFVGIHPQTDDETFSFNLSIDAGSNYNVTKTTSYWRAYNTENASATSLAYSSGYDLAQGTGFHNLNVAIGADNDQASTGFLHLFNPSSTTFVKHFIIQTTSATGSDFSVHTFISGYGNTTSAVDAIQFKMSSGNIDAGTITLYGLN